MKRYVEASTRARQLFFLASLLIVGLGLLTQQLDSILPPISKDPVAAIDQILNRSLLAAIIASAFFGAFILVALHLTRRTIDSGQWPPAGMPMPFRYPIQEIKNPRNAWLYFAALSCIFTAQIAMPWYSYLKQRADLEDLRALLTNAAQPAVPGAQTPYGVCAPEPWRWASQGERHG